MTKWLLLALAAVALVAAACSIQTIYPYGLSTPPGTASQLVGPAGGTVSANDGTSILIPPNALGAPVTVTIDLTAVAADLDGGTAVGASHVFGPAGLQLAVPACVTLAFEPPILPAGTTEQNVVVFEEVPAPEAGTDGGAGAGGDGAAAPAPYPAGIYFALPSFAAGPSHVTGMTTELGTVVLGFGGSTEELLDAGDAACTEVSGDGGD